MPFDTWDEIGRTLTAGSAAYAALVLVLRISGKRTFTKLTAFDLVVSVTLGSTLATILPNTDVSAIKGVAALAFLSADGRVHRRCGLAFSTCQRRRDPPGGFVLPDEVTSRRSRRSP